MREVRASWEIDIYLRKDRKIKVMRMHLGSIRGAYSQTGSVRVAQCWECSCGALLQCLADDMEAQTSDNCFCQTHSKCCDTDMNGTRAFPDKTHSLKGDTDEWNDKCRYNLVTANISKQRDKKWMTAYGTQKRLHESGGVPYMFSKLSRSFGREVKDLGNECGEEGHVQEINMLKCMY